MNGTRWCVYKSVSFVGTFDLKELRVALRVIGIEVSKEDFKRLLSTFEDTSGIISMVGFTMVVSDLWVCLDPPCVCGLSLQCCSGCGPVFPTLYFPRKRCWK